jgi:hypothetical protein
MDAKYTPGPWNIGSSDLPVSRMSIHCKGHKDSCHSTVALMVSRGVIGISHDEEFANARLIAAAPDLLDVAQAILAEDMLQYLPAEFVAKVRAAIAKATGEQS